MTSKSSNGLHDPDNSEFEDDVEGDWVPAEDLEVSDQDQNQEATLSQSTLQRLKKMERCWMCQQCGATNSFVIALFSFLCLILTF